MDNRTNVDPALLKEQKEAKRYLDWAHEYAMSQSGCCKAQVGSVIVKDRRTISFGANIALPDLCKMDGCLRIKLYGNNDKTHRMPSDCRALHSEIDAICRLAKIGLMNKASSNRAILYVTRYPCESCARAIVAADIAKVYYGRQQEISEQTKEIFETGNVSVVWIKDWSAEDVEN